MSKKDRIKYKVQSKHYRGRDGVCNVCRQGIQKGEKVKIIVVEFFEKKDLSTSVLVCGDMCLNEHLYYLSTHFVVVR